jgi:hypothetical protein
MTSQNVVYYKKIDPMEPYKIINEVSYYLVVDETKLSLSTLDPIPKNDKVWKEEIFILRKEIPIAYLGYSHF